MSVSLSVMHRKERKNEFLGSCIDTKAKGCIQTTSTQSRSIEIKGPMLAMPIDFHGSTLSRASIEYSTSYPLVDNIYLIILTYSFYGMHTLLFES